jgi:hypothetical protein
MKKIIAALATGSLVVALALTLVAPVGAQVTTDSTATTTTTGTTDTTGSGTATTDTTSPGLPDTGAGGDAAMNFAILLSSGLIAVGATVLLARKLAA